MLKKWIKWTGLFLGSLIGLVIVAVIVLYSIGTASANQTYAIAVTVPPIPNDATAIARGDYIAATFGLCKRCHGDNLSGDLDFDVPGLVTIPTPNLTTGAGGVGGFYRDEDWVRAIQHGVGHDGRGLFLMTSQAFHELSAEDMGALIAYLKQVPPVDHALPGRNVALFGRVMMGLGMFPPLAVDIIDHAAPQRESVSPGVTAAYGEYLTRTCTECHGAELNGMPFGPPGQEVPSPNLTPGGDLATWSEKDFFRALRDGITPSNKSISPEMPWLYYGRMTDEELRAVWLYLQSLPALPQGE